MGNLEGQVEKKWAVLLIFDVIQCLIRDELRAVIITFVKRVVRVFYLFVISPEILGEIPVGLSVGGKSEEVIETLSIWQSAIVRVTGETGFSNHCGMVADGF